MGRVKQEILGARRRGRTTEIPELFGTQIYQMYDELALPSNFWHRLKANLSFAAIFRLL